MQAPDSGILFQEELKDRPFWMLVACILVNRTHWRQAKVALEKLMIECEDAKGMDALDFSRLTEIVQPLGFKTRRARSLKGFAQDWLHWGVPESSNAVLVYTGCGLYAAQSWQIFVEGRRPKDAVTDHKLQWYLDQHPELV